MQADPSLLQWRRQLQAVEGRAADHYTAGSTNRVNKPNRDFTQHSSPIEVISNLETLIETLPYGLFRTVSAEAGAGPGIPASRTEGKERLATGGREKARGRPCPAAMRPTQTPHAKHSALRAVYALSASPAAPVRRIRWHCAASAAKSGANSPRCAGTAAREGRRRWCTDPKRCGKQPRVSTDVA